MAAMPIYGKNPSKIFFAGRYSSVGSDVAWESSGTAIDPRIRHIFLRRFGHENISTKRCALSTGNLLRGGLPSNSVDRITDRPDMTLAVYRGRKASTQKTKNKNLLRVDFHKTWYVASGTPAHHSWFK